jgi:protein-disulfide isomerase
LSNKTIQIGIPIVIIGAILIISSSSLLNLNNGSEISSQDMNMKKIQQIGHTLGDINAPITIIEFGDYQCPFCGEWYAQTSPGINEKYISTGKAKLIFIDFAFLGSDSDNAAFASYCADEQEKYWEFHGALYLNQGSPNDGWASPENVRELAKEIGINMIQFDECMTSPLHQEKLNSSLQISEENNIVQTPTFIILGPNGGIQKFEGKQPLVVFDEVIKNLN